MNVIQDTEEPGLRTAPVGYLIARAETERAAGRYDAAMRWSRESLTRSAGYSSGHVVTGRCLLETGRPSEALEHLGRAVEIDEENATALKLLADALALGGFREEAAAAYERWGRLGGDRDGGRLATRLMASRPADADRTREPGSVEPLSQEEMAVNAPGLLLESAFDPKGEFSTVTMARVCEEQGILEAALKIYESLLEKYPDDSLLVGKMAQLRRWILEAARAKEESAEPRAGA